MDETSAEPNQSLTGEKTSFRPVWTKERMMKRLGYALIKDDGVYAKYENIGGIEVPGYGIASRGYQIIYFNGEFCNNAVFVGIRRDGDTRTAFNGICKNFSEFYGILQAVR